MAMLIRLLGVVPESITIEYRKKQWGETWRAQRIGEKHP